ncbi:MAG: hypothetical protein J5526_08340 [Bacteroidales bacterium]|nr:hypothetical protein [Bacteroidales bacterium]
MKRTVLAIVLIMLAEGVMADDWDVHRPHGANRPIGLSASINVGMLIANKKQAEFYSGSRVVDTNGSHLVTYLERMVKSELFGHQIWQDLVNGGYISTSAVGTPKQLEIVEYGQMHYKLSYQIGLGIRYDWESAWGLILRFDWSRLTAVGAFNLSTGNNVILQGDNQYIRCSIGGQEDRINIDFGVAKRMYVSESIALEVDLGFNLNNLKVKSNAMEIAGTSHDILDRYGISGDGPAINSATYEYINQGGVGYGGFAGLAVCYVLPGENSVGTIDLGYNFYYERLKLEGYSGFAPQHAIFLRFNLNTFSFFDK